MVVDPLRVRRDRAERGSAVLLAVDEPADLAGLPLHREDVVVVGERALRERVGSADAVAAGIAGSVDGAVHRARLAADVLHDVDLTGARPTDGVDVAAEHPERRPDPLAARDLDARLEAAERLVELSLRLEARRGVRTRTVPAPVAGVG